MYNNKKISPTPCEPNEIREINNVKEYTLTSTSLLEMVLTDKNLNAQTTKLWQILYNRARFNDNLSVTISYRQLGEILKKSIRTIARYIKTLTQYGYLEFKSNFGHKGNQLENTLFVRAPRNQIQIIKNKKDRVKNTNNDNVIDGKIIPHDKFNEGRGDNSDRQKNNNINNNNNIIVVDLSLEKKLPDVTPNQIVDDPIINHVIENNSNPHFQKLENEILLKEQILEELTLERNKAKEAWLSEVTVKIKFEKFNRFSELDSQIMLQKFELEKLHAKKNIHLRKQPQNMHVDPYIEKSETRKTSEVSIKRLEKNLENYGYQNQRKYSLVNEILFEVEKGSLVKNRITHHIMPVDHAINIALKLIRENRWNTPTLFRNSC